MCQRVRRSVTRAPGAERYSVRHDAASRAGEGEDGEIGPIDLNLTDGAAHQVVIVVEYPDLGVQKTAFQRGPKIAETSLGGLLQTFLNPRAIGVKVDDLNPNPVQVIFLIGHVS